MLELDVLIGCIRTEAIEERGVRAISYTKGDEGDLLSIEYPLELVYYPETGELRWEE